MRENKLPLLQKIIAVFFFLLFITSIVFMAYRIYTKPAYEAHEKEQARILAVSAIELFAEKTSKEPDMWKKFESNNIELIIDHTRIKGNWVIITTFLKKESFVDAISSVNSGWNSRSPQSVKFRAKINFDGRIEYENETAASAVQMIVRSNSKPNGKVVHFRFRDERKKVPFDITTEVRSVITDSGEEYLVLK